MNFHHHHHHHICLFGLVHKTIYSDVDVIRLINLSMLRVIFRPYNLLTTHTDGNAGAMYKDDDKSQWRRAKSDPSTLQTP